MKLFGGRWPFLTLIPLVWLTAYALTYLVVDGENRDAEFRLRSISFVVESRKNDALDLQYQANISRIQSERLANFYSGMAEEEKRKEAEHNKPIKVECVCQPQACPAFVPGGYLNMGIK